VNLPLGVAAFAVIARTFHAQRSEKKPVIDYPGAALLAGGLTSVVLYTSLGGGTTYPWRAPGMIALLAGGYVLLLAFVFVEHRATDPVLPPSLFRNRVFATACAISFAIGLALFGSVTYIPIHLQVAKGHTATESGLLMTPMMRRAPTCSCSGSAWDSSCRSSSWSPRTAWITGISARPRRAWRGSGRSAAAWASPCSARSSPTSSRPTSGARCPASTRAGGSTSPR
jgi:hypothetical protein